MRTLLVTAAIASCGVFTATAQETPLGEMMPVAQQNALVQKYCAICHDDVHMNGGLSLEHFDAGHVDPGLAAMLVSKLKSKALGASGQPLPDKATQDALQSSLTAESEGFSKWTFSRAQIPASKGAILSASVVREVPPPEGVKQPWTDLYRLILTCREDNNEAGMQLAWSPGSPPQGQLMSVAVDGNQPVVYKVEGLEKMVADSGTSGPGAIWLYKTKDDPVKFAGALPERMVTVSNLFGDEKAVFSFDDLPQAARQTLSACFTGNGSASVAH